MITIMTLSEFAKEAGVIIIDCAAGWNNCHIGYRTKDHPNCSIGYFKTENSAYKHWLLDTFGVTTSKAIMKLLKQSEK